MLAMQVRAGTRLCILGRMRCAAMVVLACLSASACRTDPPPPLPPLPEGAGRGLLGFDAGPPAGARTFERPQWRAGERFVAVQGERLRGAVAVVAVEPDAYVLEVNPAVHVRRDRDLGMLGEWSSADQAPLHVLAPADVRYHWPLWVGKRWSCEFVDRLRGAEPVTMRASYTVEALESVTVPAGTFEALRIVRTAHRLDAPAEFRARTQILWYAPSIGYEVRQLVGELVELTEHARGG
jgi:hypothetical protein